MGLVSSLIQNAQEKQENLSAYNSSENIMLYGTGKSTIAASLSDLTDKPVLALSPAGGSTHLQKEFPNFVCYPVNDLKEFFAIIQDLEKTMSRIRKLRQAILKNDKEALKLFKEVLVDKSVSEEVGEKEFSELYNYAKEDEFPISAIAIEEVDVISNWYQAKVTEDLGLEELGEDKKGMGSDWNVWKRKIVEFWVRTLKLPVKTILATTELLPAEHRNLSRVMPNICTGSGSRLLESMIGNIWRCTEKDGVFKVRFMPTDNIFTKQKFKPVKEDIKLKEELNITNHPERVWQYMNKVNYGD